MTGQTVFQVIVVSMGALATGGGAILYFKRVRLERPAIGTFNTRDLVILFGFIVVLPAFYLILPSPVLTGFLVLTFASALSITLRPLVPARYRRLLIPVVLALNVVVTYTLLGTSTGLVLYWVLTSGVVLVAAVGISNLYVQGGLRVGQIGWFALFLAGYDAFFSLVIPLTPALAETFEGRPLNASIGFALNGFNANIGLGDLLVYGLFCSAAYKALGRCGAVASLATVGVFGALLPSLAPVLTAHFNLLGGSGIVVPAQVFYGPAAFALSLWLNRSSRRPVPTTPPMSLHPASTPALAGLEG